MTASARRGLTLLGAVALSVTVVWVGLDSGDAAVQAPSAQDAGPLVDTAADSELAERAFRRVELFRGGRGGARVSLTSTEITALLRHSVPGMLPAGVVDPMVVLDDGRILLRARVASDDFSGRAPLASVLGVLPDTVEVELRGRLASTPGQLVFHVDEAHAARVPLPRAAVISVAGALAARGADGLIVDDGGEPTLALGWPAGVASAEIVGDRLVLRGHEPNASAAVDGSDGP